MVFSRKRYRLRKVWLIFLIFYLLPVGRVLAMSARPEFRKSDYNLLLITIDTLRSDHLGCYGYRKIKTPNIDRLASQGALFTQAITPVPITLPAHVSIMTGQYPIQHGVRNNGNFVLNQEAVTLAEILRDKGYRTGACVGAFVLNSAFGLDQGFTSYDDSLPVQGKRVELLYSERKAEEINVSALRWLEMHGGQKFFLWLHYFDPHAAYSPPSPFSEQYQDCPYDGEIAYTDKCLGDLWQKMEKMGLLDRTIIILTADHGESLGEHGEATHAIFIYESTLKIPLIIKGPAGFWPRGKSIPTLVSNMDIFPTVLDFFGLKEVPNVPGQSLAPLIFGRAGQIHQELLCESLCPELNFGWSRLEGLRKEGWKYIQAPQPEIYCLADDLSETENLAEKDKGRLHQMKKDLERVKAAYQSGSGHTAGQQVAMQPEVRERLKSLGYVWTQSPSKEGGKKADPKEMIHLTNYLDQGLSFLNAEYYDPALLCFQKIIQFNSDNEVAHFFLGVTYQKKNLLDQAETEFQKVLALNPHHLDVHNQIGLIHYQRGDFDSALIEFKMALAQAEYPEVYYNLSLAFDKKGQRDEALTAVQETLRLDPNYAEAHNQAGNIFLSLGDPEKAAGHFETALRINPGDWSAHNNLGLLYSRQGKHELALRSFQQAALLEPNNPEVHNNLGHTYLNQRLFQEAAAELKKALALRPGYKKAIINLGMAYFYQRDFHPAEQEYRRVIEMDKDFAEAYSCLGLLYLEKGDFARALASFQEVLRLQPNDPLSHYYAGKAFHGLGKIDRAIEAWQKALSLKSDLPAAHLYLGNAFFEKDLVKEAIQEWEMALAGRNVDLFSHVMNLGRAYAQMKEYEKAARAWQKAKDFNPRNHQSYYFLGSLYLHQGYYQRAQEEIEACIRLQPDNQPARALLKRIRGSITGVP